MTQKQCNWCGSTENLFTGPNGKRYCCPQCFSQDAYHIVIAGAPQRRIPTQEEILEKLTKGEEIWI